MALTIKYLLPTLKGVQLPLEAEDVFYRSLDQLRL